MSNRHYEHRRWDSQSTAVATHGAVDITPTAVTVVQPVSDGHYEHTICDSWNAGFRMAGAAEYIAMGGIAKHIGTTRATRYLMRLEMLCISGRPEPPDALVGSVMLAPSGNTSDSIISAPFAVAKCRTLHGWHQQWCIGLWSCMPALLRQNVGSVGLYAIVGFEQDSGIPK